MPKCQGTAISTKIPKQLASKYPSIDWLPPRDTIVGSCRSPRHHGSIIVDGETTCDRYNFIALDCEFSQRCEVGEELARYYSCYYDSRLHINQV